MKNKDKKMMLFVIATIVTSFGIGYTLLKGTRAVTETPANEAFDDILFYQCVVDVYNSENNSEVSYDTSLTDAQLASIERLSCFAKVNIASAKGIEKMTSLTSLDMHYNKLSSIDLSNNKLLTYIRLSGNKITSLDVSNNTYLTRLDVSGNDITEINFGDISSLENIDVSDNLITKLNASNNNQLKFLDASGNDITEINFGDIPSLESIDVSDNLITELNVSNNKQLKSLNASRNQLTSLDVSANIVMTSLNLSGNQLAEINVSNNVELTTLMVGADNSDSGGPYDGKGNLLESLDVSKNTKLKKLAASNNKLTQLDVSKNTELTELSLYNNQLSEINIDSNSKLEILNLGFTYGCHSGFGGLACGRTYGNNLSSISLTNNPNLKELHLSNNQLKSIDLSQNKNLVYVQLSNNLLESLDMSNYEKLEYLTADENNLSSLNVGNSVNLDILIVDKNKLSALNVKGLSKLDCLIASDNMIDSIDLSDNVLLTYLEMRNNLLTNLDLSINEKIELLFLSNNKLEKLKVANNLERIYVENNQLSSLDISKNANIEYLDIDDNPYSETLYVYKGDTVNVGNNVKVPSHLDWSVPTWEVSDVNIATLDESNNLTGVALGNTTVTGIVKDKYSTVSDVNVVEITSEKYNVNYEKNYIYVGNVDNADTIKSNINVSNENVTIDVDLDNNKLMLKYQDNTFKEFKIVRLSSGVYNLDKEYIYVGSSSFNVDNINFINATSKIENNILYVMVDNLEVQQYKIVSVSSDIYMFNEGCLYISSNNFDEKNINVINASNVVENDILLIKYGDEVLKEYKLIGFSVKEYLVKGKRIVINNEVEYSAFMINVTSEDDISFELYDGNGLITEGNVTAGIKMKISYNGTVIDEYLVTDEYLEFSKEINVDDNKLMIHDIKAGTAISDVTSSIESNGIVSVIDKDGNSVADNSSRLRTGDKIKIVFAKYEIIYSISVAGDTTGDGKIDVSDIEKISEHILNNNLISGDEYLLASDYDNNGIININDIIKISDHVVNNG